MSEFNTQHNRAVWFDIPVADLDRAVNFYRAVLAVRIDKEIVGEFSLGIIEHESGTGGCLVLNKEEITGGGVLLYLNVNGRIRDAVNKVVPNGGSLIQDTHSLGPHGFRAVVLDSEGNRVALHSETDA
jgi:predicted enzyme related to lactoylglutathione lyase